MKRLPSRPSPAMVVAIIALVVALGGTSYAAVRIGSANIKTGAVNSRTLKNNDVRGKDVRNGTLSAADLGDSGKPLRRFGPINLGLTRSFPVISYGPFTVTASCVAGGGGATRLVYTLATTEPGTAFGSSLDNSANIAPTTPESQRELRSVSAPLNQFRHGAAINDAFAAIAPSGRAIEGQLHSVVNGQSRTCKGYGTYTRIK